jgi:hypothetical protein
MCWIDEEKFWEVDKNFLNGQSYFDFFTVGKVVRSTSRTSCERKIGSQEMEQSNEIFPSP